MTGLKYVSRHSITAILTHLLHHLQRTGDGWSLVPGKSVLMAVITNSIVNHWPPAPLHVIVSSRLLTSTGHVLSVEIRHPGIITARWHARDVKVSETGNTNYICWLTDDLKPSMKLTKKQLNTAIEAFQRNVSCSVVHFKTDSRKCVQQYPMLTKTCPTQRKGSRSLLWSLLKKMPGCQMTTLCSAVKRTSNCWTASRQS